MTPRRILIVSRIFAPEPAAASFRLRALARGLTEAGFTVERLPSGETLYITNAYQNPNGPKVNNAFVKTILGNLSVHRAWDRAATHPTRLVIEQAV